MHTSDWLVLSAYFAVMVGIGLWSHARIHDISDFFTGYAGIAYLYGVTSFFTWAFPIAVGVAVGSVLFAPRLSRVRSRLNVASPLEFLARRYNIPTQQAIA